MIEAKEQKSDILCPPLEEGGAKKDLYLKNTTKQVSFAFVIFLALLVGTVLLLAFSEALTKELIVLDRENEGLSIRNQSLKSDLAAAESQYASLEQFAKEYLELVHGERTQQVADLIKVVYKSNTWLGDKERKTLASVVVRESERRKLDPLLVLAVIKVESGFEPQAVSERGAKGLMQIMPETATWLQEKYFRAGDLVCSDEPKDEVATNIAMGTAYLRRLLNAYNSLDWALSAYNYGPVKINKIRKGEIPEPEEFWGFSQKVRKNYARIQRLNKKLYAEQQQAKVISQESQK